jgi:hypothetical protein
MGGGGRRTQILAHLLTGLSGGLAFHGSGDRGIHHEFGEAACGFVERVDGPADGAVVAAEDGCFEFSFGGFDLADLVVGELLPSGVGAAFFYRADNGLGFVLRFDDLAVGCLLRRCRMRRGSWFRPARR